MGRSQNELLLYSFSGGTESGSMLVKAKHDLEFRKKYFDYRRVIVIFSDTLNEFPYTYEFIKFAAQELIPEEWEFVWLHPQDGYHANSWKNGLIGHYEQYDNIGSKYFPKSCTVALKFSPIYMYVERDLIKYYGYRDRTRKEVFKDFVNDFGKLDVIIGLHYGEESRITPEEKMNIWFKNSCNVIYPLMELEYDRAKTQEVFKEYGYPVQMPSNCMICPFSTEFDLLYLYNNYPEMYHQWVKLENNKLKKHKHLGRMNKTVFGEIPLPMVLDDAKEMYENTSEAELKSLKISHGCVASTW